MVRGADHLDRRSPLYRVSRTHQLHQIRAGYLPVVQPELTSLGDIDQVGIGEIARRRLCDRISCVVLQQPLERTPPSEEGGIFLGRIPERERRDGQMIGIPELPAGSGREVGMNYLSRSVVG